MPPADDDLESLSPRELVCALCRRAYDLGWASGTGGGMSVRVGDRLYVAPSGVQKELIRPEHVFVLDSSGTVLERPSDLKLSACAPLFLACYARGAGAVVHAHSMWAMLATLTTTGNVLRVGHLEMLKGIEGHAYRDVAEIPILENTAHEAELRDALAEAIDAHPRTRAVLVRRHGVYVWGRDWREAKTQAEVYDYLFRAAVEMKRMGLDPSGG
jgi:methylthioribulose-1-phosphate dehydratase